MSGQRGWTLMDAPNFWENYQLDEQIYKIKQTAIKHKERLEKENKKALEERRQREYLINKQNEVRRYFNQQVINQRVINQRVNNQRMFQQQLNQQIINQQLLNQQLLNQQMITQQLVNESQRLLYSTSRSMNKKPVLINKKITY